MAGTNQHFIPNFLQRGFSHRQNKKGKEFYTFLYRKDQEKSEVNTKGNGSERYFYEESEQLNADPEITELEKEVYSPLITKLRTKTGLEEVKESHIPEFIAHLFARNKRLREIVRENGGFLVEEIKNYLSDSENVKKLILNDSSVLQDAIENQFDELGLPESKRLIFREQARHLLPQLVEAQKDLMRNQFVSIIEVALVNLPTLVKESHIQSLLNKPFPAARADIYRNLKWFVVPTSEILILGDFCVLFELASEARFGVFHGGDGRLINVFLPISSYQILVGAIEPVCSLTENSFYWQNGLYD